jgi:hypothetical protein
MPRLTLRPITESDLPFLLEVYMTARADELVQVSGVRSRSGKLAKPAYMICWPGVQSSRHPFNNHHRGKMKNA